MCGEWTIPLLRFAAAWRTLNQALQNPCAPTPPAGRNFRSADNKRLCHEGRERAIVPVPLRGGPGRASRRASRESGGQIHFERRLFLQRLEPEDFDPLSLRQTLQKNRLAVGEGNRVPIAACVRRNLREPDRLLFIDEILLPQRRGDAVQPQGGAGRNADYRSGFRRRCEEAFQASPDAARLQLAPFIQIRPRNQPDRTAVETV